MVHTVNWLKNGKANSSHVRPQGSTERNEPPPPEAGLAADTVAVPLSEFLARQVKHFH